MHGESYKMSLNWGEITWGSYENNLKMGVWERVTNSGYFFNKDFEPQTVSFPYVNEDFFKGKATFKKQDYSVLFVSGTYYSVDKGKVVSQKTL